MSKGLEALRLLDHIYGRSNELSIEEYEIIKKELKALEIIKKKDVDVGLLREETLESYNDIMRERYDYTEIDYTLTQEEFDLLKEVLL